MQTLAKSAKAMPVMLWGSLYSGKRYKASDYVHACIITLGCTVFIMTGSVTSRATQPALSEGKVVGSGNVDMEVWLAMIGAALMIVYLGVDGLTSTWQDGLFQRYSMGICDQVGMLGQIEVPWQRIFIAVTLFPS